MARLIFLGTSNAIPGEHNENTHMVLLGQQCTVMIDCPNSPFLRFERAGVDFNSLSDLVVTHFHPDHVSGVPQLLMNMWLMGRRKSLNIHGLAYTLDRLEALMGFYNWTTWPGFFPVRFCRLPEEALVSVLDCDDFQLLAAPVKHFIPTIGVRIEFKETNKVLAFSSDSEPCQQVINLAAGADVLVHESTGAMQGHSSAAQAGEVGRQAKVGALYLIHFPTGHFASGDLVAEARQAFGGLVTMAQDYMVLDFGKK